VFSHGQSNVVKELLNRGAILQNDSNNESPLFVALQVGRKVNHLF